MIRPEPASIGGSKPALKAPTVEFIRAAEKKTGLEIDSLIVTAVAAFLDRNKTAYNVENVAIIQEIQAPRRTLEVVALTGMDLMEIYHLMQAQELESIGALVTELGKVRTELG